MDIITVKFIQISKKTDCKVTPDQLNMVLGLNIPKYSILEGSIFPYLFCVNTIIDINNILKEYGYEIGYSQKQKILKYQFNNNHTCVSCNSGYLCYKLEKL
jgi:hypothetical protein